MNRYIATVAVALGYIVIDTRTGETVIAAEKGQPAVPLSQARFYATEEDAREAATRLNDTYWKATQ